MLTAVSVTATPSATTDLPGSRPTSQNAWACVTALNLGLMSGPLSAARRVVDLVGQQVVERGVGRGAGDVVERGQLGSRR